MTRTEERQAPSGGPEAVRLDALRGVLRRAGVDALWVSDPQDVRYLSGFSDGKDGKVLVTPDSATLYTDARYTVQAQEESPLPQVIARPPATYEHAAPTVSGLRVGVQAEHLTVAGLDDLRAHWEGADLVPLRGVLAGLRMVKSPEEIALIRRAQALADEAFLAARPRVVPGVRESEVARWIGTALRERGAEVHPMIVASGPRGAMPHGTASDRVIEDGELVTVDLVAILEGYHSDMTRTFAVGTVGGELRRIYDAVREAEAAAVQAVKPGVRAADLDALAREILTRHGLGEYFAHSLGHGVGLDVHEGPGLRATSEDVLAAGMVVTIEPGAYVPGLGGVRIEDLVLVTEDGHEVLSRSPVEDV